MAIPKFETYLPLDPTMSLLTVLSQTATSSILRSAPSPFPLSCSYSPMSSLGGFSGLPHPLLNLQSSPQHWTQNQSTSTVKLGDGFLQAWNLAYVPLSPPQACLSIQCPQTQPIPKPEPFPHPVPPPTRSIVRAWPESSTLATTLKASGTSTAPRPS